MLKRDKVIVSLVAAQFVLLLGAVAFLRASKTAQSDVVPPQRLSIPAKTVARKDVGFAGDPNSPFLLVEFGDYECPPCARSHTVVKELLKKYPRLLKFQFRHFPLTMHAQAMPAALLAEEARAKGLFWETHDALYKLQGSVSTTALQGVRDQLGLSRNSATATEASHFKRMVNRDQQDAKLLSVEATPTFILCCPDGRVLRLSRLDQIEQFLHQKQQ